MHSLDSGRRNPYPHPPQPPPAPTPSVCRAVWAPSAFRRGHEGQAIPGHARSLSEQGGQGEEGAGEKRRESGGKASPSAQRRAQDRGHRSRTGWALWVLAWPRNPHEGWHTQAGRPVTFRPRSSQTPVPRATSVGQHPGGFRISSSRSPPGGQALSVLPLESLSRPGPLFLPCCGPAGGPSLSLPKLALVTQSRWVIYVYRKSGHHLLLSPL